MKTITPFLISFLFTLLYHTSYGQSSMLTPMRYDQLESSIQELRKDRDIVVVNFWATWCIPCVQELPHFEKLQHNNTDKAAFLYASLDFEKQIESKLKPFLKKNSFMQSNTVVLDQSDANNWIPIVNERWSGAIPATIVISHSGTKFHEGAFDNADDLHNFIFADNK